jgi:hypothetical protein
MGRRNEDEEEIKQELIMLQTTEQQHSIEGSVFFI